MSSRLIVLGFSFLLLNSCLITRAELAESEQYQVYNRKNATNQAANQPTNQRGSRASDRSQESQISSRQQSIEVDERDELIRSYNGKIETLENQINILQKEKASANAATSAETQKLQAMQESFTKMEAQIQSLQVENANLKAEIEARKSSDEAAGVAHKSTAGKVVSSKSESTKPSESLKTSTKTTKATAQTTTQTTTEAKSSVKANPYDVAQEHFSKKEWKKAILSYQKYVDENPKWQIS